MAAKKKSGKTRGTDAGGNVFDLDNYAQHKAELNRFHEARNSRLQAQAQANPSVKRNQYGIVQKTQPDPQLPRSKAERQSWRNIVDSSKNYRYTQNRGGVPAKGPIPMGPAKTDPLRGRTVEFGTRSMLEGVRGFMRGGGGLRSHGK